MSSFLGIFGSVVFIFGLLGFFFLGNPMNFPIVGFHLVLGILALVFWSVKYGLKGFGDASSAVVGKTARFGYGAGLYIVILISILAAANWIAEKNNQRLDLSKEGVYSLSPQSKSVTEGLKRPLKLVAFKNQESVNEQQVKDLFALYKYSNPGKISYEIVDPRIKPLLAEKYEMKSGNAIYLQLGDDTDAKKSVARINEVSEQALTNAVLKLTRGESKKIYLIEGHGEPTLQDAAATGLKALAEAMKDENLTSEGIFLGEKSAVPDDAAAVLVVSPQRDIPAREKEMLVNYANNGGRLLLFTDPQSPPDIAEMASRFGITVSNDVVVDLVQRLFGPLALGAEIVARDYSATHPITKGFAADSITIFNMASSLAYVEPQEKQANAAKYEAIVKSGKKSWAERNLKQLFDAQQASADFSESEDLKGPVSLAVAYEKNISSVPEKSAPDSAKAEFDKVSRVVVFGDSDFIRNQSLSSYANRDLVLNSVNWMIGEEGGLEIRPRSIKASVAPLTRQQLMGILSSGLVMPELLLLFGLFVWWSRRATSR